MVNLTKSCSPRPGIEPGPSTWQAEILTTRLSRIDSKLLLNRVEITASADNAHTNLGEKQKRLEKYQSFEPDLNQRPMDFCYTDNYSPPLYQLSYRRCCSPRENQEYLREMPDLWWISTSARQWWTKDLLSWQCFLNQSGEAGRQGKLSC